VGKVRDTPAQKKIKGGRSGFGRGGTSGGKEGKSTKKTEGSPKESFERQKI